MASVKPRFNKTKIENAIRAQRKVIDDAVLHILQMVGEEFIVNARSLNTYQDQTGNLRSSVGYVLLRNGLQYDISTRKFFRVKKGRLLSNVLEPNVLISDNHHNELSKAAEYDNAGVQAAENLLEELMNKYDGHRGWVLIGVAGMGYAAAVEAKGFDVISGSSQIATVALKKAMETLKKKLSKRSL